MKSRSAFTLIELLTVIAIIGILAGITYGISTGVYQRQARTKAQAELSAIASALEAYRSQYQSYPVTEEPEVLLDALENELVPEADGGDVSMVSKSTAGRPFIDMDKVTLNSEETYLVDPWGKPYQYGYENDPRQTSWKRFGFLLFSNGPDGKNAGGVPGDGLPEKDAEDNRDNIYAGG